MLRLIWVLATIVLSMSAIPATAPSTSWVLGPWTRASDEPILRPDPASNFLDPLTGTSVHWEALHTFNPAAIVRNGKINVLYRAEDDSGVMAIGEHVSRLGLAISDDGIHFTRQPAPVLYPARDAQISREIDGGVEDPRIVEAPGGTYVLTYTQWSRRLQRYSVGIATSRDLRTWIKHGPAFGEGPGNPYATLKYKSAAMLTERKGDRIVAAKLQGKFWMYWGEIEVGLATSPDLIHWTPVQDASGKPIVLLRRRDGHSDSAFPETGPPPLLTPRGIVMLYNAKNGEGADADPSLGPGAYSVHEALFSSSDPTHLLERTDRPVFAPELPFERTGQYGAGTTFGEGLVWFHNKWWLYYGCADSFVGVATAPSGDPDRH